MLNIKRLLFVLASTALIQGVTATRKCIWAHGLIKCHKDPSKQVSVEIRAYDRDGFSIFKLLDSDDLMGITFTDENGAFELDGCGSDMNWFPGIPNDPDPYIQIHHYCNNPEGETIELPEFYTFVPNSYDAGEIVLDEDNDHYQAFVTTKRPTIFDYKTNTHTDSFVPYIKSSRTTPYVYNKHKTTQEIEQTTPFSAKSKSANDLTAVTLPDDVVVSVDAHDERVPVLNN